jgi:hypothetical protein
MDAGMFALVTLPTSPFWARRHTRSFLDSWRGMTLSTAETAELLVSELVTNAVRFSGDPARTLRYSERANARLISLSLRHFREGLLVEVYDTDSNPPILSGHDDFAENGRVLMLIDAPSREWSYFFPPGLSVPSANYRQTSARLPRITPHTCLSRPICRQSTSSLPNVQRTRRSTEV